MLKAYLMDSDSQLSADELMEKYRGELENLCTIDKDTKESFGYVNTWWVFGEVAPRTNYKVFMAEAENIGYKRTKRGEKEQPNELFTLEYAPQKLDVEKIHKNYRNGIIKMEEQIEKEQEKKEKEKKPEKREQIDKRIELLMAEKERIRTEYEEIKAFTLKYYDGDTLKKMYMERTDEALVEEFRCGRLQEYRSNYVALHKSTYVTVLDHMRDIEWE